MTKTCIICNKEFEPRNSKHLCCSKECSKQNYKNYYQKNKQKIIAQAKIYRDNNKDKIKQYQKNYRDKHTIYYNKFCMICGKEFVTTRSYDVCCCKECNKIKKRKQTQEYLNKRYKDNINFRLTVLFRTQLRRCLDKINNYNKELCTFDILNYTPLQLKQRLEFQFKNGMSWDNFGTYWVVHHKKELHKFNFGTKNNIDYKQIRIAHSLANLQPVTIEEHKLIHSF